MLVTTNITKIHGNHLYKDLDLARADFEDHWRASPELGKEGARSKLAGVRAERHGGGGRRAATSGAAHGGWWPAASTGGAPTAAAVDDERLAAAEHVPAVAGCLGGRRGASGGWWRGGSGSEGPTRALAGRRVRHGGGGEWR